MSLRRAPLLYVFLETSRLVRQREVFEGLLRLQVIELEPHLPHHRHGVVKYDAGGIIISLNLTGPSRFRDDESDALTMVFSAGPRWSPELLYRAPRLLTVHDGGLLTDSCGHHLMVTASLDGDLGHPPRVEALRLCVRDLAESIAFYQETLGLELLWRADDRAAFATGTAQLVLERGERSADGRLPRTSTSLVVFHTPDIAATHEALVRRGVEFRSGHAGFSEIGGTIRFDDPSGHRLCLYEPSDESLTWGSGPKVLELAGQGAGR